MKVMKISYSRYCEGSKKLHHVDRGLATYGFIACTDYGDTQLCQLVQRGN